MPQQVFVDQRATFALVLFMASEPRRRYRDGQWSPQETTSDGTLRWDCQVAVTPTSGMGRPEVIKVGIASSKDPSEGLQPGQAVSFVALECGLMIPRDGAKASVWFRAAAMHPAIAGRKEG